MGITVEAHWGESRCPMCGAADRTSLHHGDLVEKQEKEDICVSLFQCLSIFAWCYILSGWEPHLLRSCWIVCPDDVTLSSLSSLLLGQ